MTIAQGIYSEHLARALPDLGRRELEAVALENHWHECPTRYSGENRKSSYGGYSHARG